MKWLGCVCFIFYANSILAASGVVQSFHRIHHHHSLQFKFDLNQQVTYHHFNLKAPPRIVIDLKHVKWGPNWYRKSFTSGVVRRIRIGRPAKHHLRLVFDLARSVHPQISQIQKPRHQLVITFPKTSHSKATSAAHVIKNLKARDIEIVIDPGHGGKDPGAVGHRRYQEKDIVLSISKQLQDALNQRAGFKAVLTRHNDRYITLRQRLMIARKQHADMFVAIHADAYKNTTAHGASVYALSRHGATSEAARWLAKKENESELGGVSLANKSRLLRSVLLDLSQTAVIGSSLQVGYAVLSQLDQVAALHHPKVEQAAFVVLKSPDIPSILIECGFISNTQEEDRLQNPNYQQRLAQAIDNGIYQYFRQRPPRGTWLALAKQKQIHYQVQKGDDLTHIAKRFHTTIREIMEANHLENAKLKVGQRLVINVEPRGS